MFRALKTMFVKNPEAKAIFKVKIYCDQFFEASYPDMDLKGFMNDPEVVRDSGLSAMRTLIGLFVVALVGNTHLILSLTERTLIGARYLLYSDHFGLESHAADALMKPVVELRDSVMGKKSRLGARTPSSRFGPIKPSLRSWCKQSRQLSA